MASVIIYIINNTKIISYFKNIGEKVAIELEPMEKPAGVYEHYEMQRLGVGPTVMLGLFVCPTISMVTATKTAGQKKKLYFGHGSICLIGCE